MNGDIEGEGLGAVAVHANNATARAGFPNPARVKGAEVKKKAHRHGIRLFLRNAGKCGVDNDRVLAVLMTKCRDQHRRIVAGSVKQWRFRTR